MILFAFISGVVVRWLLSHTSLREILLVGRPIQDVCCRAERAFELRIKIWQARNLIELRGRGLLCRPLGAYRQVLEEVFLKR
jgi:hypothetical protein